jgi:hypothetical protein
MIMMMRMVFCDEFQFEIETYLTCQTCLHLWYNLFQFVVKQMLVSISTWLTYVSFQESNLNFLLKTHRVPIARQPNYLCSSYVA